MLVVKTRHSFRSMGPDRVATAKAEALPQLAKARGWNFALLADERTMAGALDFLAEAANTGIAAAAGIQVTGLAWRGYDIGVVLMPLGQTGLRRLIAHADALQSAERLDDVLAALRPTGDTTGPIDITAFLMPGREIVATRTDELAELRTAILDARIGPVIAQVEAGGDGAELHHAPWGPAADMHERGAMALARLTMGYAAEDMGVTFQDALTALAEDNGDKIAGKGSRHRPRMPARIGIPVMDPIREDEPTAAVAASIVARVTTSTLKATPELPARLGLADGEDAATTLRSLARAGMEDRIVKGQAVTPSVARAQLEHELDVITDLGFSNYFLVMQEAISFARSAGIPVGPGRGSVAGSMAAYALGLTNIDPIRHKLLFERFINPERVSLPDIDTDFCEDRRHEVIAHMAERYGEERVAHIATYASNKPRGAVKTAGRILNLSAAAVRLIGMVELRLGKVRMLEEEELNERTTKVIAEIAAEEADGDIRHLATLATAFLGIAANQSVHAGGIVLCDDPIRTKVPLHSARTENGRLLVQTDMKATEKSGLVKFDFLGLTTLTIIAHCLEMLQAHEIDIDLDALPMDDAGVFEMLRRGKTRTVFQLESPGISQAARDIGVDSFEDIVALVALYRPGPMEHIAKYASRKRGLTPVNYTDPAMEEALADTYGIIIYQEQIMAIARAFANYTLAEADILRKAIGKKNMKLLQSQREAFIDKSVEAGHDRELAEEVFEFILPFAEYGFNRSHAAAYGTLTYQTAWLKHHYPAEWYAACATRKTKPEDRVKVIADAARMGVPLVLPDVNLSGRDFITIRDDASPARMILPMRVVDGTRGDAIDAILAARTQHGPFRSFVHLLSVTDSSADPSLEALIRVGACDSLSDLPATIARPHFEYLLDQPQHRMQKVRDTRQVDLLSSQAGPQDLRDPAPRLWPHDQQGIRALAPDEAIAVQERLLKGMIDHQGGQMKATGWLRAIEGLLDLASAEKVAGKSPTRTLAVLVSLTDREHPGSDGRRVLQATVEDDTGRRTYDIAPGTDVHPDLPSSKGRVVRLLLSPSPGEAYIADRPIVSAIGVCENPLSQDPPTYPIIHVDEEITDALRDELRMAMLGASREHRKTKTKTGTPATSATHALLVPPSRTIEPLEMTTAVRFLGPAQVFGGLGNVIQVIQ